MLKKSPQKYLCGVLLFLKKIKEKAKGEEKPEEELMGKRKSSPRLATTSIDAVAIIITTEPFCYTYEFALWVFVPENTL